MYASGLARGGVDAATVQRRFVGDKVCARILRDGKEMDVDVTLAGPSMLVPRGQYDTRPPFCLVGALPNLPSCLPSHTRLLKALALCEPLRLLRNKAPRNQPRAAPLLVRQRTKSNYDSCTATAEREWSLVDALDGTSVSSIHDPMLVNDRNCTRLSTGSE